MEASLKERLEFRRFDQVARYPYLPEFESQIP